MEFQKTRHQKRQAGGGLFVRRHGGRQLVFQVAARWSLGQRHPRQADVWRIQHRRCGP